MADLSRVLQRWLRRVKSRLNPPKTVSLQKPLIVKLPRTYVDASQSLIDESVFKDVAFIRKMSAPNLEGGHPDLVRFYKAFQKELNARHMPFYLFEMKRSLSRQNQLYKLGRTMAKAGQSPHQTGQGFDLIHFVKLWDLTEKQWAIIGAIGKEVARRQKIKITWGGDFRSIYDPAHWELTEWRKNKPKKKKA